MKHVLLIPDNGTVPWILGKTDNFRAFMREYLRENSHLKTVFKGRSIILARNSCGNREIIFAWKLLAREEEARILAVHAKIKAITDQYIMRSESVLTNQNQ